MTQEQLNERWDACLRGDPSEWAAVDHGDIHILRRLTPRDEMWERKAPDGKWTEVAAMKQPRA